MMKCLFTTFLTITFLALSTNAKAESGAMAVLELFTSPFCSDTPPADEAFKNIVGDNDQNVIALSCHVTYFNQSDKKDQLSDELCDKRHSAYFISLDLGGIDTPQIIINGEFDTTGDVEKTVRAGARMVQSIKTTTPVPLTLHEDTLEITLAKKNLNKPVDVWLFGYDKDRSIEILTETDDNSTLNYTNTVSHLKKLETWDGSQRNMSYSLKDIPADGYAVIVQYADHTNIIAAGKVER